MRNAIIVWGFIITGCVDREDCWVFGTYSEKTIIGYQRAYLNGPKFDTPEKASAFARENNLRICGTVVPDGGAK